MRKRPFFRPQIDSEIEEKLERRRTVERYRGTLTSYVEGILDKYADGLLIENREAPMRADLVAFEEKHDKRHKRAS